MGAHGRNRTRDENRVNIIYTHKISVRYLTCTTIYGTVEKNPSYAVSRRRRRRVKAIVYITWLRMRSGPHSDPGPDDDGGGGHLRGFSCAWRTGTWRTRAHRLGCLRVCISDESVSCPRTVRITRPRRVFETGFSRNVPNTP